MDREKIAQLDSLGIFGLLNLFPGQVEEALGLSVELPAFEFDHVVILGMGGSALGGDLLKNLLKDKYAKPISIVRDYNLPAFVNEKTLVVASSYSGNTEETLAATEAALGRKAKIVVVAADGELQKFAESNNLPLVKLPGGLPPRMSWAYQAIPVLNALASDFFSAPIKDETISVLKAARDEFSNLDGNPALELANKLNGKQAVIYSAPDASLAAYKWKINFNENAKHLAFSNVFSELNHNEMLGFEHPEELARKTVVIYLKRLTDSQRIIERMEITRDIIGSEVAEVVEVVAKGTNPVTELFYLIYFGDFVSYYLAILNGVDPGPVEKIEKLKTELKKSHPA